MQFKEEDLNIIYKVKVGSHAYGTNISESDEDFKMIYLQKPEDALNYGYQEQVNLSKDSTAYELRRYLELCCTGNPTMLELAYSPEDCIIYKHPIFDEILNNKEKFLSKSCRWSFGGYAISQIEKASGLEKKMNWEKERVIRKTPIDFCWAVVDEGVIPLTKYLEDIGLTQKQVILTKLNHSKEGHQLFISDLETRGIVVDGSNNIRTSEVPKASIPHCTVLFNPDVYSRHCSEYRAYEEWLKERNTQRYVDIQNHDQKIDGKNLLHCVRLLETGIELAKEHKINVRRPNAEYLISIRRGKVDLKTILDSCQAKLNELDQAYKESTLPDKADRGFWLSLMVKIRNQYAKL